MYYNDDIKKEFISEMSYVNMNFEIIMNEIFNRLKPYETELKKDACNFTIGEILSFYKGICTFSMERLLVITSHLKRYTRWCMGRNLVNDGQNHYEEINNEIVKTCLNTSKTERLIISREELLDAIRSLTNPSDRFVCLACFEGLYDTSMNMLNLRWEDFDEQNSTCHVGDRTLHVSSELIKAAKESAETYQYIPYTLNSTRDTKYDISDPRCIKNTVNTLSGETPTRRKRNLTNKFIRIKDFLGNNAFQLYPLRDSGRIHFIKQLHDASDKSLRETIGQNRELIEQYFGPITSINRYVLKYGEYFGE